MLGMYASTQAILGFWPRIGRAFETVLPWAEFFFFFFVGNGGRSGLSFKVWGVIEFTRLAPKVAAVVCVGFCSVLWRFFAAFAAWWGEREKAGKPCAFKSASPEEGHVCCIMF